MTLTKHMIIHRSRTKTKLDIDGRYWRVVRRTCCSLTENCEDEACKRSNDERIQDPGDDIDESENSFEPLHTGGKRQQQIVRGCAQGPAASL
jgi:hypothetical protein